MFQLTMLHTRSALDIMKVCKSDACTAMNEDDKRKKNKKCMTWLFETT